MAGTIFKLSQNASYSLQRTSFIPCRARTCVQSLARGLTGAAGSRPSSTQAAHKQEGAESVDHDTAPPVTPLTEEDYFGVRNLFTVEDLFKARVHLGHKAGSRNPYMKPYIFGSRLGMDIIDLDQTALMLGDALNVTAHIAARGGILLMLSRHKQTLLEVERTALEVGEYSHCREWKGGTFTNASKQYGLVTRLPDLGIFISTHNTIFEQHIGVVEMAKMNIPTVGIVDTSCDPRLINYPVPANDDSPAAISLYLKLFKEAILRGKAEFKKNTEEE